MKIVQFRDGTYGVRRWSWLQLGWEYLGLLVPGTNFWWSRSNHLFRDCITDDVNVAIAAMNEVITGPDYGIPIRSLPEKGK